MKKLFLFAALMTAMMVGATEVVTTVFSMVGNENKTFGAATSITNGSPAVTFTYANSVLQGAEPAAPSFSTANYITINGKYSTADPTPSGRNMLMGDISGFASPFNPVLKNTDADSIVWTFNMRSSDTNGANGLGRGRRSTAAVIAMDNSNLLVGNGYGIINNNTTSNPARAQYRFVRITNGLDTATNLTQLLSYTATGKAPWMVFKVVYVPATDKWIMYCKDMSGEETDARWPDPLTVDFEKVGEVTDATFTSNTMTTFGFYNGYHGKSTYYNLNARNFTVRTFKDDTPAPEPEPMPEPNVILYHASFTAGSSTSMAGLSYGSPEVTWTNTKYNHGEAEDCTDPTIQSELNVPGRRGENSKGRNILTAPLSEFDTPWTSKLNESEADSIVWMFNMRYNYDYTSSFDAGSRGIATVLVMDDADMMTANGYAIVNNASYYYRLVRFDGGLSANDNITVLASTDKLTKNDGTGSSNKRYMSFRVVYVPSTDQWKMYYFANNASSYVAPADVTAWILAGTVTDDTHTGKSMTHFGFMNNYLQGTGFDATLSVKNFTLGAHCQVPGPATGIDEIKTQSQSQKLLRDGQLIILRGDKEYNAIGQSIH